MSDIYSDLVYGYDYFGFVYIWYDRKRKWFCIGSHYGSLDDGYTSSTGFFKNAIKARPEDFKRKILHIHTEDNRETLYDEEQYWLDMIKREELYNTENSKNKTVRYFNIKKTASGFDPFILSQINREKVENGTHHCLTINGGDERARKLVYQQIEAGKHASQNPESVEKIRQKAIERVENGTSNFLGERNPATRAYKAGTHKQLKANGGSEYSREREKKKVEADTHHYLSENGGSENATKTNLKRVEDRTHPFLKENGGSEMSKQVQNEKVKKGTHHFLKENRRKIYCPHCKKDIDAAAFARYHGDKCKYKDANTLENIEE